MQYRLLQSFLAKTTNFTISNSVLLNFIPYKNILHSLQYPLKNFILCIFNISNYAI
jgi:hypothetical protein